MVKEHLREFHLTHRSCLFAVPLVNTFTRSRNDNVLNFKARLAEMCNFPWKHLIFWKKKWSRPISHEYKTMLVFTSQKQSYRPWDPCQSKNRIYKTWTLEFQLPIHWGYTPSLPNHPSSQQKNQAALAPALVFYEMKPAVVAEDRLLVTGGGGHILAQGSCRRFLEAVTVWFAYPLTQQDSPTCLSSSQVCLKNFHHFSRMSLPIWESCNLWSCKPFSNLSFCKTHRLGPHPWLSCALGHVQCFLRC